MHCAQVADVVVVSLLSSVDELKGLENNTNTFLQMANLIING